VRQGSLEASTSRPTSQYAYPNTRPQKHTELQVARNIRPAGAIAASARQVASGRRAHQRCSVLGWPWRIDFSRAEATFISSSGRATSISFLRYAVIGLPLFSGSYYRQCSHTKPQPKTIISRKDAKNAKIFNSPKGLKLLLKMGGSSEILLS
jgi:hypothetical protein